MKIYEIVDLKYERNNPPHPDILTTRQTLGKLRGSKEGKCAAAYHVVIDAIRTRR